MLAKVKCPWKWLEDRLNEIVDQVNRQIPVKGDGIILNPGPAGTIIAVEPVSQDSTDDSSNTSGSTLSPNVSS